MDRDRHGVPGVDTRCAALPPRLVGRLQVQKGPSEGALHKHRGPLSGTELDVLPLSVRGADSGPALRQDANGREAGSQGQARGDTRSSSPGPIESVSGTTHHPPPMAGSL